MKTRAAVAFEAKKPLEIVEVDLEGPKAGEVLVEIKATGICHTMPTRLTASTAKEFFRRFSVMRAPASSAKWGPGVTSVKAGDHVIPLYTPECRQCKSCLSQKTNLCTAITRHAGQGCDAGRHLAFSHKGKPIFHLHGLLDLLELYRAAGNRGGKDSRGRAVSTRAATSVAG